MLKNILLFISLLLLLLLTVVNSSFKPPHNKHDNHKHKHDGNDVNQRLNE